MISVFFPFDFWLVIFFTIFYIVFLFSVFKFRFLIFDYIFIFFAFIPHQITPVTDRPGKYCIQDLGSAGGTFIRIQSGQRKRLNAGECEEYYTRFIFYYHERSWVMYYFFGLLVFFITFIYLSILFLPDYPCNGQAW